MGVGWEETLMPEDAMIWAGHKHVTGKKGPQKNMSADAVLAR